MSRSPHAKKLSIDLINLPKLRHRSTHVPKLHTQTPFSRPSSRQRKTSSYLIPKPKTQKSPSKLQFNLSLQRSHFQDRTNLNLSLLNNTFIKLDLSKKTFEERKKLQKRKVFPTEKHQFISRQEQKVMTGMTRNFLKNSDQENENEPIYTGPVIVTDYKIEMSALSNCCFDGIFSISRTGATLSFKDDTLYLFGGFGDSPQTTLLFHNYCLGSRQWRQIRSLGQKPTLPLMYHTCNSHKHHLVFTGGVALNKTELKKHPNPYINIFNLSTSAWTQLHWGHYLKHHVSCMVGNVLFLHGGINQRERTENAVHVVHLNFGNLHFSKIFTFESSEALSHHQMVTTMNEEARVRTKLSIDGMILFGGKRSNQQLSNQLYVLKAANFKLTDDDPNQAKKWHLLPIEGPKPQPRMCHTFDLLQNKGLCVLVGGINEHNDYLSDMWIFNLFSLTWTQVEDVPLLQQTGGLAYHCTVVNDSEVYLYGGITKNKTHKQFYLIETQKFKREVSKTHIRKKTEFSSNNISFKTFEEV